MESVFLSVIGARAVAGPISLSLCYYKNVDVAFLKNQIDSVVEGIESPLDWSREANFYKVLKVLSIEELRILKLSSSIEVNLIDTHRSKENIQREIDRLFYKLGKETGERATDIELVIHPDLEPNIIIPKGIARRVAEPREVVELTYSHWLTRQEYRDELEQNYSAVYRYDITTEEPQWTLNHLLKVLEVGPSFGFHRLKAVKRIPVILSRNIQKGLIDQDMKKFFVKPPNWWFKFFQYDPFIDRKLEAEELISFVRQQKSESLRQIDVREKDCHEWQVSIFEIGSDILYGKSNYIRRNSEIGSREFKSARKLGHV